MSEFGIPYMGSKAKIIKSLALNFPAAENFYDLFGGGFAVSHYMLKHKNTRYKYFHYNEIKADVVELVKKAINGDFNYNVFKPEWISRQEFFARKDNDAYVRCLWSFGNRQEKYLFSYENDLLKKSLHMAVIFDVFDETAEKLLGVKKWPSALKTFTQKRLYCRRKVKAVAGRLDLQQLQQLQQLERLQRLEQLEQLEQLERLSFYSNDYRDVEIKNDSVVYCDPPYANTEGYLSTFDNREFLNWAAEQSCPVFISEYNISDSRFKKVYEIDKRSMLCPARKRKRKKSPPERLYWNGIN